MKLNARARVSHGATLTFGDRWFRVYQEAPAQGAPITSPPPAQAQAAPAFDTAPLLAAVRQSVTELVAPVQQAQVALTARIDALSAPQPQAQSAASRLFGAPGAAPGIRQGEDSMSSRGFQYSRAAAMFQGIIPADQCKVERQMHDMLSRHMRQQGFSPEGDRSMLFPLWVDAIPGLSEQQTADIRATVQQGAIGCDAGELRSLVQRSRNVAVTQALSQFDDTALGVLLGSTQQGDLIELIRAREVFSRAGATNIALPPNGRLRFPKQTGAATAYWVGESAAITASEQTTGDLDFIAKKLAVLVKLPNELLRFGNPSVEAFVRNDMARVMALEADSAMLSGVGTTVKPKGLLTYANIQTHTASTTATDGDTFEPEDPALMVAKLQDANHDTEGLGASWVLRPLFRATIFNKRATPYSGGTGKGEFLFEVDRSSSQNGLVGRLAGYPIVTSTQLPRDGAKGSGTSLYQTLVGVFAHWMIGRVGVAEFAQSNQGDTPFVNDQTWLRVIQHMDAGPRYEDAFIKCINLLLA